MRDPGIVRLLESMGLSGPRLFLAASTVSAIILALSYLSASYPSNQRKQKRSK